MKRFKLYCFLENGTLTRTTSWVLASSETALYCWSGDGPFMSTASRVTFGHVKIFALNEE